MAGRTIVAVALVLLAMSARATVLEETDPPVLDFLGMGTAIPGPMEDDMMGDEDAVAGDYEAAAEDPAQVARPAPAAPRKLTGDIPRMTPAQQTPVKTAHSTSLQRWSFGNWAALGAMSPSERKNLAMALTASAGLLFVLGLMILGRHFTDGKRRRASLLAGGKYGEVLGQVNLSPTASIHFVRSADRVLVVGVSDKQVTLLTQLDFASFEAGEGLPQLARADAADGSFVAELRANLNRLQAPAPVQGDEVMSSLRGELRRLQETLKEAD